MTMTIEYFMIFYNLVLIYLFHKEQKKKRKFNFFLSVNYKQRIKTFWFVRCLASLKYLINNELFHIASKIKVGKVSLLLINLKDFRDHLKF